MKCEARSFWLSDASQVTPNTLTYDSNCASTEPSNSQARAPESSEYGASGPGFMRPRCPRSEIATAKMGGAARAKPHGPTDFVPTAKSAMHAMMRTVPSDPCMSP